MVAGADVAKANQGFMVWNLRELRQGKAVLQLGDVGHCIVCLVCDVPVGLVHHVKKKRRSRRRKKRRRRRMRRRKQEKGEENEDKEEQEGDFCLEVMHHMLRQ